MFCTNCEFEIKGDDRKECPVCGGPLIDFAEVKTSSEEITSTLETDRWEETRNAPKEKAPYDLGKALDGDGDNTLQKPEERTPLHSQLESELEPERAGTSRPTEEVVTEPPYSCNNLPGQIIAAAQQAELKPPSASRKQLALSVMAVLALVAAITTIAIFKPQGRFYPDIGHLKTKTEKAVVKILSIVTQREEKKAVAQKIPEQNSRIEQRHREHPPGNGNPDKKLSRLEKLSPGGKGKEATVKKQFKAAHGNPLARQETHHTRIDSFKETSPSTLYSIHTGSFKNKEVAVAERERLKKMGFHAYIQTVELENGATWHRIKVGSYSTRTEAENTQNELRQKVPTLKSYIMRRVTESEKTATKREGTTAIAKTETTSFVSGQAKRKRSQRRPDVPETVPPLKQSFAPEVGQPLTGMKGTSNLTSPSGEVHQTVSEDGAALPLLKEHFVPEIEQLIREMGGNPFTALLVREEIPQEDAGSIGTIPADTPPQEDHPSKMHIVPGDMVHEGQEIVAPVE